MRKVLYNKQVDNKTFEKFSGFKQCFSTCAWMFICFYNKLFNAKDDSQLAKYFDDVEASVGKRGIGEKIRDKYKWIRGKTSYWGLVQKAGIQKYLPKKEIVFDTEFSIYKLIEQVKKGPVIISTDKLGGLRGGHIILLVDYDEPHGAFIVNDPFGDANNYYTQHNDGEGVMYGYYWLLNFINKGENKCWILYAK